MVSSFLVVTHLRSRLVLLPLHTDDPWVTFLYRAVAVVSSPRHGRHPGSRKCLIICVIDKRASVSLPL